MTPSLTFDQSFGLPLIGIDEVGCGPWAGPVIAAAVLIKEVEPLKPLEGKVCDSKKLSPKKREELFSILSHHHSIEYGLGVASVEEIDNSSIRQATFLAMQRAMSKIASDNVPLLIDGNARPTFTSNPIHMIIKGDGQSFAIAAASILAKVTRDRLMAVLHQDYPQYGWKKNAGYGTAAHQEALAKYGVTPHHRRSYAPIARLLEKNQL